MSQKKRPDVTWSCKTDKFKAALVEKAFRVLKSDLKLRPVWHQYSGRTKAHAIVCVLAFALWKTLDHLAKQTGLQTEIRKPDPKRPQAAPKARPMPPR